MRVLLLLVFVTMAGAADRPPNVVFIPADDLGVTDIGAYVRHFTGAKADDLFFETPHLAHSNDKEIFPEGYTTDLFTGRAVSFLARHKEKPFFLFLSYNAPHNARPGVLQAPASYIKKFAGLGSNTTARRGGRVASLAQGKAVLTTPKRAPLDQTNRCAPKLSRVICEKIRNVSRTGLIIV